MTSVQDVMIETLDGVSDHHLVSVLFSLGVDGLPTLPLLRTVRKPPLLRMKPDQFATAFTGMIRSPRVSSMDMHRFTEFWASSVNSVVDRLCPLKLTNRYKHPSPQPWVTPDLQELLYKRKRLHRRWLKDTSNVQLKEQYRATRREGTKLNRQLRSDFYMERFSHCPRNPRRQWQILNGLLGRAKVTCKIPVGTDMLTQTFSAQVRDTSRPAQILLPTGPQAKGSFTDFHIPSLDCVQNLLQQVDPFKSPGSDNIHPHLLSNNAECLAETLTDIFSESLSTGVFPQLYKVASVRPIYKKGDRTAPSNYRPVSLLPVVSKLLEKLVHSQLQQYINDRGLLPAQQFAYRKSHSCEDALSLCINKWQRAIDEGQVVAVAFLDLSKAFDCVQHQQLIDDLFECGIGGTVLEWFASYLSDRSQQVACVGCAAGQPYPCSRGVPQGSVLGPVLFSLYTRLLPREVSDECQLYADDTCLYAMSTCASDAVHKLEQRVSKANIFYEGRGLVLNEQKTQFMVIRKPGAPTHSSLQVNNHRVTPATSAKYLGIIIDDHLTFQDQVSHLRQTVARKLGMFRHARRNLTHAAKRLFYISFIQSTLEYASTAYVHSLRPGVFSDLEHIAKRALKIVFRLPFSTPSAVILSRYNLIPLTVRFNIKLYMFVYRLLHSTASPLLRQIISLRSGSNACTHARTRGQTTASLVLPSASSRYGYFSLSFLASDRWNSLPSAIRSAPSPARFRMQIHDWLGYPVRRRTSVGPP